MSKLKIVRLVMILVFSLIAFLLVRMSLYIWLPPIFVVLFQSLFMLSIRIEEIKERNWRPYGYFNGDGFLFI